MSTLDERVAAVRAVLAGADLARVAEGLHVEAELVARWCALYGEGGRLRLAGRMDPDSFEARDRFLPIIAHEFRTPLTIIKGWVELLQAGALDEGRAASALGVVAEQVVALERLSADAIDAGAVARGTLRLGLATLDLRALVAGMVRPSSAPVQLAPGDPVPVVADADRLERVTGSVLGHARRLAAGLPVVVSVGSAPGQRALVEVAIVGRSVGFEVVASLFEPYDREDTSIGTGLGLFLARGLIAAHGGEIGVRSEGEDTVFWYRIPTAGPESPTGRNPR